MQWPQDFIENGLHALLDRLCCIFFFYLLDLDSLCYFCSVACPMNFSSDLINLLVKSASRGRSKWKERVMVQDDVFFGKETVIGENKGMIYQGLVWEVVKGLMEWWQ